MKVEVEKAGGIDGISTKTGIIESQHACRGGRAFRRGRRQYRVASSGESRPHPHLYFHVSCCCEVLIFKTWYMYLFLSIYFWMLQASFFTDDPFPLLFNEFFQDHV